MRTTEPESAAEGLDPRFRVFLAGHTVSVLGSKMQTAALLWHIYQLTGSPVALGALGAVEMVPLVLLASLGGVAADRLDRVRVLGVAQLVQGIPAVALGLATLGGQDAVWLIYAAAAASAAAQGFDSSARKSLIPRLVKPEELTRAMSWVDLVKNVGKLAGPAVMGILVSMVGLGWVYVLNGATFLAMVAALALLPRGVGAPAAASAAAAEPVVGPFRSLYNTVADGFRFARGTPVVWSLLWLDFLATFFAAAESLLPIVADDVLDVGARGYGVLASAAALGALIAGTVLLSDVPRPRLGRLSLGSVALFGLATVGFGLSGTFWACFAALVAVGAADTVSTVVRNTMLQLHTPDALRGRVTSVSVMFSKSGPRLGQLEAGLVAGAFGVGASIVSGGVLCVVAAGWMAWRHPWLWDAHEPEQAL